jgi:hypothetical protein
MVANEAERGHVLAPKHNLKLARRNASRANGDAHAHHHADRTPFCVKLPLLKLWNLRQTGSGSLAERHPYRGSHHPP